jgi:hypothetical protein
MADNNLLKQMLEHLVNEDQAKAEELFHDYVVAQSREIYESMIDSEIAEEEDKDEDDEEVDEAAHEEKDEDDEDLDENFEDIAIEGDDDMDDMGDTPDMGDDLEGEMGPDEDDGEEKSEEELFMDLESIVDELQAKFDEMKDGHSEPDADNMGGESDMDADNEGYELDTVREYVEKVAGGFGAKIGGDNGANAKSVVAGKNDMGGTSANIVKGGVEAESASTKGGLANPATKENNAGNINVPGGKAGSAFSKKEPGHGAEKKGAAESADNKQSLFRGRR